MEERKYETKWILFGVGVFLMVIGDISYIMQGFSGVDGLIMFVGGVIILMMSLISVQITELRKEIKHNRE